MSYETNLTKLFIITLSALPGENFILSKEECFTFAGYNIISIISKTKKIKIRLSLSVLFLWEFEKSIVDWYWKWLFCWRISKSASLRHAYVYNYIGTTYTMFVQHVNSQKLNFSPPILQIVTPTKADILNRAYCEFLKATKRQTNSITNFILFYFYSRFILVFYY